MAETSIYDFSPTFDGGDIGLNEKLVGTACLLV